MSGTNQNQRSKLQLSSARKRVTRVKRGKHVTRVKRVKTRKRCQENKTRSTQRSISWLEHVTPLFKPIGELRKLTTKGDTR